MKRRVTRISVMRTSCTVTLVSTVTALVAGIALTMFVTLVGAFAGWKVDWIEGPRVIGAWGSMIIATGLTIFGTVLSAAVGFLLTLLVSVIYNIVSRRTGGVEITLSE